METKIKSGNQDYVVDAPLGEALEIFKKYKEGNATEEEAAKITLVAEYTESSEA